MAMITIKGTDKIKGALDLTGINKQLKAGDRIPLSEEDFTDHTVQLAVSMGFITYEQGGILAAESHNDTIKLRNIYDRSIRINALDDEIRPGQTFTLSSKQANSADIRGALAKGFLEIVASAHATDSGSENTVKVGNLFDDSKTTQEATTESPTIIDEGKRYLETNEELSDPSVIDTPDPRPVDNKKDVHDPKRKSVIWNPTKDPVAHSRKTQMEAISIGKDGDAQDIESNVDVSEINFVDESLDKERVAAHPILKDKVQNNDGIDFL